MNISVEGAYIEEASCVQMDGEFVSFEDDDGVTIFITPEVVAQLYRVAFPGEFS